MEFDFIRPAPKYYHLLCLPQLKDLLERSIAAWVELFDERNPEHLPSLKMELVYDDEKMQFYPPCEELIELILGIVEIISKSLQQVRSWLSDRHG